MARSDQELLTGMASGDRGAFAEFFDRHAPRVLGLLCKWLGQRSDAEDVLQETFWQVWCRAGQYDAARAAPEAWLVLIARSRAMDHRRRQRPAPALPDGPGPADPASALERSEQTQQVRTALASLPEEQRSAISLAFYGGLTYEQVAQHQAIPLGTAKTRIRLGMRRLRSLLLGEGSAP